jgi:hypothetical protein
MLATIAARAHDIFIHRSRFLLPDSLACVSLYGELMVLFDDFSCANEACKILTLLRAHLRASIAIRSYYAVPLLWKRTLFQ